MNRIYLSVFLLFLFFLVIGCSVQSQKEEEKKDVIEIDSAYAVKPFLKNTIYIYNDNVSKAKLIDYDYTPPQEYWLKEITIQIKNNIAIVCTDCELRHKILSAEYYGFGTTKLAILKTNKGEIRIAKNDGTLDISYHFEIKYGNFKAETGFSSLYCRLPEEQLSNMKNNISTDSINDPFAKFFSNDSNK
ncbi:MULTISPECIES: hypothetical protein [Bacteroides]|uniref:hypothetical protein n=1 Tax=Bacteroides TaxID=816 RepID=UPI002A7F7AA4|nr:hypothetical protein [Bacteroides nordii]